MSLGLADIRRQFLSYFEENGHSIVPSSPLVPMNDPTLLFTNAGMVPFKNYFTGQEATPYARAASSQKCVRAGGKHNDLDNVGYTARHHTFFEMLGNFSFGDYFKEEAIYYAWQFLTNELAIPQEKLLVTVYAEDEDARSLWRKIGGLEDARIISIATSDNFWSMGDTGPCGPCSEIFYDHGAAIPGGPPGSPDEDGDRFIEIWNLVFMQYEQAADGTRTPLPKPCIDTGMGLERIAAVLQGEHDNYDTDLFKALTSASADISGQAANGAFKMSHRVIADHLRSAAFLIADGVMPSNEGRGYVLRRIMRRAMRHAHILGADAPLMWRLVPTLKAQMGQAYPELERADALITETLRQEEDRFRETLARGLRLLDDALSDVQGKELSGDVAFKLYDTYGFPIDLTQDALRERGYGVDLAGFDAAMERQRSEARANWAGSGAQATEDVWFSIREQAGATEFVGYQSAEADGDVLALLKNGVVVDSAETGEDVALVMNQTPFYGESGGQSGDTGMAINTNGGRLSVSDTQKKLGDMHVLLAKIEEGGVKVGDRLHQSIDVTRRQSIRSNHSATHLLHEALRRVLGPHVTQKGSLVQDGYLRFDFSHGKPISGEDLRNVEELVNEQVRGNGEVTTRLMTPDEAINAGALALFGEKYGAEVRVLSMGDQSVAEGRSGYSVELCGGTHVSRLGDIGVFTITSESAVAAGIRRIEARTGAGAIAYFNDMEDTVRLLADELKVGQGDVVSRVQKLIEERKRLERELAAAKKQAAMGGAEGDFDAAIREVNGIAVMANVIEGLPARELRGLVDAGKQHIKTGIVVFISIEDGKAGIAVGVSADLSERFSAVDLVRLGAAALGGKGGGGRPDMAQAGGPNGAAAPEAIEAIAAALSA